jgi:hypothetical protein
MIKPGLEAAKQPFVQPQIRAVARIILVPVETDIFVQR